MNKKILVIFCLGLLFLLAMGGVLFVNTDRVVCDFVNIDKSYNGQPICYSYNYFHYFNILKEVNG